ncbi:MULTISPECIES: DUF6809 family protein [unclassified Paenibacillus]|uniref:DUF6809 family protein n=1 Tax=unclassified Paenibacillus TaxID=185978 RepID=UPI0009CCBEBB|nr:MULTISPECIES: DUF6809 family protein [unclassified Paenibacillus]SLJ92137.1 hypothetical protein SAMN06272722_101989 [Paenibacillus sp. RU5A]SOC58659.1 hypothetical protein SAMN05880581_101201 [Paenibacillus sp. RU26A]SOC67711.1 hypothetical protein SAMN05880586_101201 [Paenibacillus sp. RU5M]
MKDNMSNLIEDLFHGNLRLDESIHPEHVEYQEINRQILDLMQGYKTKFTENEYDALEQLVDLIGQSTSMLLKQRLSKVFAQAVNSSLRFYANRE